MQVRGKGNPIKNVCLRKVRLENDIISYYQYEEEASQIIKN